MKTRSEMVVEALADKVVGGPPTTVWGIAKDILGEEPESRWQAIKITEEAKECPRKKVYFVLAEEVSRVKIGVSTWPERRLTNLKTASPVPLSLMATMKGGEAVERFLHRRFHEHRLHGEWFNLSPEIQEYITSLE